MRSRIQTFRVTEKDEDILEFIKGKFGNHVSLGYAIKESLRRYAKMCGYKGDKKPNE